MNRILLSLVPVAAAYTALGQTPAAPPESPANLVTESSKVARFLAGPGDHPQGFLLLNGTFVILPPGLSQQIPSATPTDASISVAGNEFTYGGSRTIHARRILVGGITYEDVRPAPPPPPQPPAARDAMAEPAPRPCTATSAPAPPAPPAPPRRPPALPTGARPAPPPPTPPAR